MLADECAAPLGGSVRARPSGLTSYDASVVARGRCAWIVALLLATACGGTPAATLVTPGPAASAAGPSASTPPAASAGATAASVTLEQPADGATVPAGDLVIGVKAAGFQLVDKLGSPAVPGEGHVLYYVGVDFIPTEPGRPATTAPGTFVASAQPTHRWPGLTPGTYGIGVQLVNNDDTPLVPAATARAKITVAGEQEPQQPNPNPNPNPNQ